MRCSTRVNQSNVSQYAHLLPEGVQALIAKGFSCPVYPTHRTVCYPDYVLSAMAQNVNRSVLLNNGRDGFSGGLGGIPFPLINTSDDALKVGRPADLEPSDALDRGLAE